MRERRDTRSRDKEGGGSEFEERLVFVNRCAKVVKGGRRYSFGAVVVVGNRNGLVSYGYGKANEVADAIRKGTDGAKKSLASVNLAGRTIPHPVKGDWDGASVLLWPASPGTGVIAGGGMRAVLELAGVRDVLAKSLGCSNKLNVVKATLWALQQLRPASECGGMQRAEEAPAVAEAKDSASEIKEGVA